MSKISKEEVKKIASLAKLSFSDSELEKFTKELESILEYVSQIEECDVSGIPDEHNLKNYVGNVFYEDEPSKNLISRDRLLMNATNGRSKNGYIRTSKIVSKEE